MRQMLKKKKNILEEDFVRYWDPVCRVDVLYTHTYYI